MRFLRGRDRGVLLGVREHVMTMNGTKAAMHRNAFGVLLDQCLKVTADDHLLVIYDESLSPYHEGLSQALRERSLFPTLRCFCRRRSSRVWWTKLRPGVTTRNPCFPKASPRRSVVAAWY